MTLKITTLSENTADNLGLLAEWGLSILVETDDANILLDTGQTISVGHNAEKPWVLTCIKWTRLS